MNNEILETQCPVIKKFEDLKVSKEELWIYQIEWYRHQWSVSLDEALVRLNTDEMVSIGFRKFISTLIKGKLA